MENRFDSVTDSFASENRILFKRQALKSFNKLNSKRLRDRINARIQRLAIEPYPVGCKKLEGVQNIWRIRQGSYRVWYEPRCDVGEIEIVWLGHHQDDSHKPNFMKRIA